MCQEVSGRASENLNRTFCPPIKGRREKKFSGARHLNEAKIKEIISNFCYILMRILLKVLIYRKLINRNLMKIIEKRN